MNRSEILEKLNDIFAQRKQESILKHRKRVAEVSRHPELEAAIIDRHSTILFNIKNAIGREQQSGTDLRQAMEEKNANIRRLLVKYGYPEDYLEPVYHCAICKDEGKVYTPGAKECSCYVEEYNRLNFAQSGFSQRERQRFADYNPDLYSTEKLPGREFSQRDYMQKICDHLKLYVSEFPDNKRTTRNLLFTGKSGLGKTFFMGAIANELLSKRRIVQCVTAYKWFEMAKKAYFGEDSASYENLLSADLLMIDDMGTEPLHENITVPQLFNVINERHNRGLHTILSTNLEMVKFAERYTERVTSRFEDRRFATIIHFLGEDLRRSMGK